ncbi:Por secretion system C-terminal sorting domain-containing protein [Bizionia echini]|uniref:Por secretion system C-terminal sorting domain-containing protein n=1 Tax=Bizionia echini TaxID=649333 RepID=A0A1I4ZNU9_9FLAO|nr:T9SS-dependent M36 family metallopeptidase [Bizionia echini]SFN51945.1 Por secretion system C-terminal sorting domain-containing protein [Bizionia echini]
MKNNYAKKLLFLAVLVFANVVYSQSKLMDSNYASVIQNYLNQNKDKFGLTVSDISDLSVENEYLSKNTKITHVYVNQRYQGVAILNAVSSVAIKGNVVFYYANNFIGNINDKVNTVSPQLTAEQAIQNAATSLNLGSVQNLDLVKNVNNNNYVFSNGNISQTNIPVRLVYFQNETGNLILSWDLSIHTLDGANWYSVRVDAISGEILNQNDWILACNFGDNQHENHNHLVNASNQKSSDFQLFKDASYLADGSQYNVFALPVESPNHGSRTLLSEPADLNASPFGWHDTNGVTGAEFTNTRGNNVWAMEDRNGNDGFGYSPNGSTSLNFDFPLNLNQQPELYQDASITNLFYVNNVMHDIWYQYGFDEVSGNFQANNYGNGGVGNDYVRADGQDGNGIGGSINNAFFGTPPDGSNPTMRMFLWSAPAGVQDLVTVNNSSALGTYAAVNPATTAPNNLPGIGTTPVTADLQLVNDNSANPSEGCSAIASVAGKIAVIRRGTCPFVDKIQNAQNAGAVAVIVVNHNNPTNDPAYVPYVNMAGETNPPLNIPSVFMNFADGELLIAAMQNETVNVTLQGPSPFMLDGSLDNMIVAHEYGHGISNRLTGGPSQAGCLTNQTQMGEGWSDWFALMITLQDTEDYAAGRGMVTYASGQGVNGIGIRNAKYATDFSVNGFTYADTNNAAQVSQPHGIGFIWATMLYDLTEAYVAKYGFDADIYNGTGGNNKVMQLVLDGLKLQPCGPDFIEARDALLAADMATTGGEDQCMIWEVFANRGLGINASGGSKFSRTDQVEDFTMPLETDPSLQNCTSLSVDEFRQSDYRVYPNPTNNNLFIKTNKSFGQVTMTITDMNGRQVYNKQVDLFGTVEINMNTLQSGIYILNMKGLNIDANHKIIKN